MEIPRTPTKNDRSANPGSLIYELIWLGDSTQKDRRQPRRELHCLSFSVHRNPPAARSGSAPPGGRPGHAFCSIAVACATLPSVPVTISSTRSTCTAARCSTSFSITAICADCARAVFPTSFAVSLTSSRFCAGHLHPSARCPFSRSRVDSNAGHPISSAFAEISFIHPLQGTLQRDQHPQQHQRLHQHTDRRSPR